MVKTPRLLQGAQIRFLVRELRSCKPWGVQILFHHLAYEIKHCPNSWRPPMQILLPKLQSPYLYPREKNHHPDWEFITMYFLVGFPGGSNSKESACNMGDPGSIPGSGRSPGEGNGYPLQHSCLENSMDSGTWWAIVLGVPKSWTWLRDSLFFRALFS